jgi:hypothetical protein
MALTALQERIRARVRRGATPGRSEAWWLAWETWAKGVRSLDTLGEFAAEKQRMDEAAAARRKAKKALRDRFDEKLGVSPSSVKKRRTAKTDKPLDPWEQWHRGLMADLAAALAPFPFVGPFRANPHAKAELAAIEAVEAKWSAIEPPHAATPSIHVRPAEPQKLSGSTRQAA